MEVRPSTDPTGAVRVLLQLPNGYALLWPADARRLADVLREVADEVEAGSPSESGGQ